MTDDTCTWCSHPAHDPARCRAQIEVAADHAGGPLPRRWGDRPATIPCPCALHNERTRP